MMILLRRRRQYVWVLPILAVVFVIFGCVGAFQFGGLGGTAVPKIPQSPRERNQQVVQAVQAALQSPRTPSFRLIECEFPAVAQLNKLGDGSLRSATAVEDANLETAQALVRALSPLLPGFGPLVWLLTSTAATNSLQTKADKVAKAAGGNHHSLKLGLPAGVKSRDVCVLVTPSNSQDYELAKRIANDGNSVVLINGFAKDPKSVSGDATMAYYLKPLTYNSAVAGYLLRSFPGPWTILLDAAPGRPSLLLGRSSDAEILVPNTNTPDLRAAVRLVQKAVDERAIRARQQQQQTTTRGSR